jgi:hypothetical protein
LARKRGYLVGVRGARAITSGHASCLLCPKAWHDEHGLYSQDYPISSDIDFIYRVHNSGAHIEYVNFPVAIFDNYGISSLSRHKAHLEVLKIHKLHFGLLRTFLMWFRLKFLSF